MPPTEPVVLSCTQKTPSHHALLLGSFRSDTTLSNFSHTVSVEIQVCGPFDKTEYTMESISYSCILVFACDGWMAHEIVSLVSRSKIAHISELTLVISFSVFGCLVSCPVQRKSYAGHEIAVGRGLASSLPILVTRVL
jgi:hypothetical protein